MSANTNKKAKSFRLSQAVTDLIEKAAKKTGLSEAEVVDGCVINQVDSVVARYERLRKPEAVDAIAAAGSKRPRDERCDKGTTRSKESRAGQVLTKRQES